MAKRECQYSSATHHSKDRVTVYHGSVTPTILCGFHAQSVMLPDVLKAIRERA